MQHAAWQHQGKGKRGGSNACAGNYTWRREGGLVWASFRAGHARWRRVGVRAVLRFPITSCVAWRLVGTLSVASRPSRPGRGPTLKASPWAVSAALCAACVCLVFNGAAAFNGDLSPWDVSSVTLMGSSTSMGVEGVGGRGHVADGWWRTSCGMCSWWKWRGRSSGGAVRVARPSRGLLRHAAWQPQGMGRAGRRSNACAENDT